MGKIIFRAKNITETSKAASWIAANGDLHLNAGKATVQQKGNNGVQLKIGQPPAAQDKTVPEVEAIKLVTTLDKGVDDGGATVNGMLFGKSYQFEVTSFKNGTPPANDEMIHWAYEYTKLNGELVKDVLAGAVGKTIAIHIAAKEACGTQLTIKAFIQQPDKGAKLTNRVHYRFRFFPRNNVVTEVNATKAAPDKIDQNSTPLCGIAALSYLLAKGDAAGYEQLVLELHQKGEYLYKTFEVKPLDEKLYDMEPTAQNKDYPHNFSGPMRYADWLMMASIKNTEVRAYEGKQGEEWDGITWPWDVLPMMKKLLDYQTVNDHTHYVSRITPFSRFTNKKQDLLDMQAALGEGYKVVMLIDAGLLSDNRNYTITLTNWHWIVFEGDVVIDDAAETYTFSYYTWAHKYVKKVFRQSVFNSNFYGYISAK